MQVGDKVIVRSGKRRLRGVLLEAHPNDEAVLVRLDGKTKPRAYLREAVWPADGWKVPANRLTRKPIYMQTGEEPEWLEKDRPVRSPSYLKWIRSLRCAWSKSRPVEASHHPRTGHGRMAKKTSDLRSLPLTSEVHARFHQHGTIGNMTGEQTRAWVEEQITQHLSRYLTEVMGVGKAA